MGNYSPPERTNRESKSIPRSSKFHLVILLTKLFLAADFIVLFWLSFTYNTLYCGRECKSDKQLDRQVAKCQENVLPTPAETEFYYNHLARSLDSISAFQIGLVQNTGSPSLTYVTATLVILPLIANFQRTRILRPMHNPNAE